MRFQPAIASPSLGHPTVHPIVEKLRQASAHGFKLIEIVEDDLNTYANNLPGASEIANKVRAAEFVKSVCDQVGLKIIVLQPFWFYDGLLDRTEHNLKIEKIRF